MVVPNLFFELSIIVVIALIISLIVKILRQPAIIGYILTGILVSPYLLNIIQTKSDFSAFATLGIALLLFMVGLNLNPGVIKKVGKVALLTGLGQIIFTFIIGFIVAKFLGFSSVISVYISIALVFSSTIIIIKLLSDKNETESLHGKIAIGFLIVQDIVAIFIIMIISSFSSPNLSLSALVLESLLKGSALIIGTLLVGIYILPGFTKFAAKSQELLLLFSLGWCLALASLFYYFNFSIEIGALLAGVTLSLSPYRYEISSRMRPLRDFFLLLFFIILGSQMAFTNLSQYIIPIIVFSLLALIGKPIIVMTLMGSLNYTRRTGFLCGLTVAQISEFSFIIILLGIKLGHLGPSSNEILSLVTLVGLITIAGSTYAINYSNKIYSIFSKPLRIFERKGKKVDEIAYHKKEPYEVILFGYNRIGYDLLKAFKYINKKPLIVEYNPDTIAELGERGIDCRYGDASDSELLSELDFSKVKMVVSTIPELEINLLLLRHLRKINKTAIFIGISHQLEETEKLYREGASYVIMPHFLGGYHTAHLIKTFGFSTEKFDKERLSHIQRLKERKAQGHEHPQHDRYHSK